MAANLSAPAALRATGRAFPGAAGQVRAARRFLAGVLDGCPAGDDALLCLSELAANAVLHSWSGRPGGAFTVVAATVPGWLRVGVCDQGGPWRPGDVAGPGGRGLVIVARLASRWGRDGGDAGRTVWFEIDW